MSAATATKNRPAKGLKPDTQDRSYPKTHEPYAEGLRLPRYRRHKASGRAVIQYAPIWGKHPHYLRGNHGSPESLADYRRCCQRIVAHKLGKQDVKRRRPRKQITVVATIQAFLQWATGQYGGKGNREFDHFRRAVRLLRIRYRYRPLRKIGPVRLKRVRQDMVDAGWSRKYVNAQFNRLRAVFAWGVENEFVGATQLARLKVIRALRKGHTEAPDRPPVKPVPWLVASAVLPYVSPTIATMIEVQYLTGMRSAELTTMTIRQIEFLADAWLYRPASHKTDYRGKPKVIVIGPRAQLLLIPYLAGLGHDAFVFSPRTAMREHVQARAAASKTKRYGQRKDSRLKLSRYRARYFADSYRQAIDHGFDRLDRARCEKCLRWHPHQLRHTRATLTRENYGLEGSQTQLGNTPQATEIYAEKNLPLAMKIALETG